MSDLMIMEGAGTCPLIKIGDTVKGREIIDIVFARDSGTTCRAFRALAVLRYAYLQTLCYFDPPDVVNCKECPVLVSDPRHMLKTKSWGEVLGQEVPVPLEHEHRNRFEPLEHKHRNRFEPPKHKHRNRFELIDITEEEDSKDSKE